MIHVDIAKEHHGLKLVFSVSVSRNNKLRVGECCSKSQAIVANASVYIKDNVITIK